MNDFKNISFENFETDKFEKIYHDMLVQFPKSELKSKARFLELLNTKKYKIFIFKDNNLIVGYVLLLIEKDFVWLDYLAVFKEFHSKGYGSAIMSSLCANFNGFKGCFLEVEKINENDINTLRRVRFYEKLGAYRLKRNYFYPNENGFLPMDLFFLPFKGKINLPDNKIDKCIIKTFSVLHSDLPHFEEVLKLNITPKIN